MKKDTFEKLEEILNEIFDQGFKTSDFCLEVELADVRKSFKKLHKHLNYFYHEKQNYKGSMEVLSICLHGCIHDLGEAMKLKETKELKRKGLTNQKNPDTI